MDVACTVTQETPSKFRVVVGETKSGKGMKYAFIQVCKRLLVMESAIIATNAKTTVDLVGEVFTTKSWNNPDNTEFEVWMMEEGLKVNERNLYCNVYKW